MKKETRQGGFTLIELLVVVAILTVLAAIVFPVFARAKRSAYATSCISNMRQVYLAMELYYQDNDNWLEPLAGVHLVQPYARSKAMFSCPEDHYVKKQPNGYPTKIGFRWNDARQEYVDFRISFAYVADYDVGSRRFWNVIQDKSPIGVIACQWHGDLLEAAPPAFSNVMNPSLDGVIHRIVFDGHLHKVRERREKIPFSVSDMFYSPYDRAPGGDLN